VADRSRLHSGGINHRGQVSRKKSGLEFLGISRAENLLRVDSRLVYSQLFILPSHAN
jgi:hypothetical protein